VPSPGLSRGLKGVGKSCPFAVWRHWVLECYPYCALHGITVTRQAMRRRFSEVSGFVLAGGASRRMGVDKATLVLGHETLIGRELRLLRSICRFVAVIGPVSKFSGLDVPVFADEVPGRGPLGGIYTGLRRTRTEFNLFMSCDLPFMESRLLGFLCDRALETEADVTLAQSSDKRLQPLCAVYRRRALTAVRTTLDSGDGKVSRFFSRVHCDVVPWKELNRAGFLPRTFGNMNTREEYEAARSAFGSARWSGQA